MHTARSLGDFSTSISASETAVERCGQGTLFPVLVSSEIADGTRTSFLNIVSGNDAKSPGVSFLGLHRSHPLHADDSRR